MSNITNIAGLPVIDAKRPIKLSITLDDIKKANTKAPNACAVARACQRQLHVLEARVHLSRIYLRTNDSNWVRYSTPRCIRSEIIAFDRGGAFQPIDAVLGPLSPSKAVTGKAQGAPKKKTAHSAPKRKRQAPHVVTDVRGGPA